MEQQDRNDGPPYFSYVIILLLIVLLLVALSFLLAPILVGSIYPSPPS
jgi:hypothetical protein